MHTHIIMHPYACRKHLYFFTMKSSMKKLDFMEQLNQSFKKGGLSCSFNDNQMAEYVQQKIRAAGRIEKKYAVAKIGFQKKTSRDAGCWVLGPSLYFDRDGKPLNPEASKYVSGRGIAPQSTACPIPKPLSLRPLHKLFKWLERNMKHNFIPTVLVIGGCAMAMHYRKLAKKCMFCPVPLAFGYRTSGAVRCRLRAWCSFSHSFTCAQAEAVRVNQ